MEKVHDALCAEARACLAAITTATDHGMMRVQLESDSKILVNLIDFDKSRGMFYLKKQSFFYPRNLLVLSYVPRSCNRCVHALACLGMSWDLDQSNIWVDPLQEFVTTLMVHDSGESSMI